MKRTDQARITALSDGLKRFEKRKPLPGIANKDARSSLIAQLVESIRRIDYIKAIRQRPISRERCKPGDLFDPHKAALLKAADGDLDEAFWLTFLSVHFGKHRRKKWMVTRLIYGAFTDEPYWTWKRTSKDPAAFRRWLKQHESKLKGIGFGNHRKYQSLSGTSPTGTGAAFQSYIDWVQANGGHDQLIASAIKEAKGDPKAAFDFLYESMKSVTSFGRMGRFDYLTMISKLGLAEIEAASTYRDGATGPFAGACLLFGGSTSRRFSRNELEEWLIKFGEELNVGMQVVEDALCNWQKSPNKFKAFRG